MAYDEELADRVRELVDLAPGVSEQRMFGGLAFLINAEHVKPMVMRGREMSGWLRVDTLAVSTDSQLEQWVARGVGTRVPYPSRSRTSAVEPSAEPKPTDARTAPHQWTRLRAHRQDSACGCQVPEAM